MRRLIVLSGPLTCFIGTNLQHGFTLSTTMKEYVKGAGREKRQTKRPAGQINRHSEKKPFDKKKYRLQKYSNKFKVEQWEERRKKAVLRRYYKELHKEQRCTKEKPSVLTDSPEQGETSDQTTRKPNAFFKAKQEFLRKKDEKRKRREEIERIKAERKEALEKYKQKKMQAYKKLSKKTKKGQPVMKERLEMLLEKIQASVN